ncbi:hypothetical protein O2W18_07265 [Modestobacter sp. VKM Ac-2983]|uniref:hypothetical protein n=1 Tax=Modestobacter sp. VKM Ac-2983 TaxID=3004137 RepID=UPI0022ABBC26|nr:hypothetical protein [Modestobacter sp. VKM Ac-2983]MCZ2804892.1 hypothetical protein [Modestobacter sp. VKM Ac-2983]
MTSCSQQRLGCTKCRGSELRAAVDKQAGDTLEVELTERMVTPTRRLPHLQTNG